MIALLGGVDITEWCQRIVHAPELNIRSYAEVEVPSEFVDLVEGEDELVIQEAGNVHVGRAFYGEDTGSEDDAFTVIQSYDPRWLWDRRQVMDPDGDYSDPSIIEDNENAPLIMLAAIENSIINDGPMDITVNSADGSADPLIGWRPTDWPMTLEQLREFLVSTGQLDLVVNHIPNGGSTVDLYKGDFGSDLTGSIAFDYGTGTFNCIAARYTFDFTKTVSRIRYLLGPKRPQYDGDVQHWAGDVQIDDPKLDLPPFDTLEPTIEALSAALEAVLPLLRRIDIHDSEGDENTLRDLYMHIWQSDMLVFCRPQRLLTFTPEPGLNPTMVPGDLVSVAAELMDSHSSTARVYSYRKEQDVDGNVSLTQVTTSADQETA